MHVEHADDVEVGEVLGEDEHCVAWMELVIADREGVLSPTSAGLAASMPSNQDESFVWV